MDIENVPIKDTDMTMQEIDYLEMMRSRHAPRELQSKARVLLVESRTDLSLKDVLDMTAPNFEKLEDRVLRVLDTVAGRMTEERRARRAEEVEASQDDDCCDDPDCPAKLIASMFEGLFGVRARPARASRVHRKPANDTQLDPSQAEAWDKLRKTLD